MNFNLKNKGVLNEMDNYTIRDILKKFDLESDIDDEFLDCDPSVVSKFDAITDYSIETEFGEKVFVFKGFYDDNDPRSFELKLAKNKGNAKDPFTFKHICIDGEERTLDYILTYDGNIIMESD